MKLKNSHIIIALNGLLFLVSCELFQIKEEAQSEEDKPAIARANNAYLYPEDLEGIVPHGMNKEDSLNRINGYIKNWAKKQLLINEAATKIEFNEAEIERKILDYRYSLMGYEYQTYYINKNLNTTVSEDEILSYYEKNIDNFILKQNIIRGKFLAVSKEAPNTGDVKKLITSRKEKDLEDLKSYCLSYSIAFQIQDSTWINFEELVEGTPFVEIPNKVQYLKKNKYAEAEDDKHLYFLVISEYKISDEISPLEFVKDRIETIIINKRKIELASQLEKQVYDKAVQSKEFEIYQN